MELLKSIDYRWVGMQVLLPILGPVIISTVVVLFWVSLDEKFIPNWLLIVDVGPWALVFYTVTLVFTSLQSLLPKAKDHGVLVGAMIVVALFVTIYAGCMELFRQSALQKMASTDAAAVAIPGSAYYVAVLLLLIAVCLCHQAYRKSRGA